LIVDDPPSKHMMFARSGGGGYPNTRLLPQGSDELLQQWDNNYCPGWNSLVDSGLPAHTYISSQMRSL
jgi:hypothetical protein